METNVTNLKEKINPLYDLCSYVGLVPNIYQSGETKHVRGLTYRCNHLLRSYFIESAWIAVRRDPELTEYYRKHIGKKIAAKIIVKVARKLLVRMYYKCVINTCSS